MRTKKKKQELIFLLFSLFVSLYIYIDPGIISRPSLIESSILNKELYLKINDILIKCKYCLTCHMIRLPCSSHCPICSYCISIYDHHCPFLSTCIGMRNYRFFTLFLIFLLQTELYFFAISLIKVFN